MEPSAEDLGASNHEETGQQSTNLHISDVLDAIHNTDPTFEPAVQQSGADMYPVPGPSHPTQQSQSLSHPRRRQNAYVNIREQPASKSLRFRYECEGRSAGSIPGVNSTPENKTYPTIEIVGYKGPAVVVVSCVTKDQPYRPHPHNLVGKDGCKKGVCTVEINSESMIASFSNLGIQCVKKRDIESALRQREEIKVDPYRTGYPQRSQHSNIDLNAVRLCFQVFLEGKDKGRYTQSLYPVVSDIIYDKKAMSDLQIIKLSHCSAPVVGGREIILLCEKVAKEDISIRFYEEVNGEVVWESRGDFQHANVHKQVAITFRSPRYKTITDVDQPIPVWIQLKRPSDGATSEPLPFEMTPLDSDPVLMGHKRKKIDLNNYALQNLQRPLQDRASIDMLAQPYANTCNLFVPPQDQAIKLEPRDRTSPYNPQNNLFIADTIYRTQYNSPSPQPQPGTSRSPMTFTNISTSPMPPYTAEPANHWVGNTGISEVHDLTNMDNQYSDLLFNNNPDLLIVPDYNTICQPEPPDIRMNLEHENMTDSFTRLGFQAIDDLVKSAKQ